jgi:hypothetical protein
MAEIADAIDQAGAEQTRRDEAQAQLDAQAAELLARVNGSDADGEDADGEDGAAGDGEAGDGQEGDGDGEGQQQDGEGDGEQRDAVAAGAGPADGDGDAAPPAGGARTQARRLAPLGAVAGRRPASAAPREIAPRVRMTAGADVPGVSAGGAIRDRRHLADVTARKLDATRSAPGTFIVASLTWEYPQERQASENVETAMARIEAARSPEALVAAGGICGPVTPRFDQLRLATTDRPVRDALLGFDASRGGMAFNPPARLGDLDAAVSAWTEANDRVPGSDGPATKPCVEIDCADTETVYVDGIPLCITFPNMIGRFSPERVASNTDVGLATHARFAELRLLTKIDAASTAVTDADTLGASRALLTSLVQARAGLIARHRMDPDTRVRVILPFVARDMLRVDIARQLATDIGSAVNPFSITNENVDAWLRNTGINPSWTLDDDLIGAQAAGPLNPFPATITYRMYPEGSFVFLDGGRLDLGVVRDLDLIKANKYATFVETFENVALVGPEALSVTLTTAPTGASAGTVVPAA